MLKKKSILFFHQIILIAFISLSILRMGFSLLNYLYYPVAGVAILWSFYILIKHIHVDSYRFFLPVIIFLIFFLAWSVPDLIHLNTYLIGETSRLVETVTFIILMIYFLNNCKYTGLGWFLMNLRKVFIIIPSIFAFIGLLSFLINFLSLEGSTFDLILGNYSSTTLVSDYNFYTLTLVYGLILILYSFSRNLIRHKQLYGSLFVILSFAIFFSGSRRGILFLTIFLLIWIFHFLNKQTIIDYRIKKTQLAIGISVFTFFTFFMFFYWGYMNISGEKKFNLTQNNKIKYEFLKEDLGNFFYSYRSIWKEEDKSTFIKRSWQSKFNPKFPYTYTWRTYKNVHPITGKGAEMVPDGSVGLRIDSSVNASTWDGNAYRYITYFSDTIKEGDIVKASVYCYVSENFDGSWAKISADGPISGKSSTEYNIDNKGEWQKLSIKIYSNGGKIRLHLYLKYANNTRFKDMNGYVIFAHPEYELIKNSQQKGDIKKKIETINRHNFMFAPSLNKSNFNLKKRFGSSRIKRWLFAWQIFKGYSIPQKLFGNGFKYLRLYNEEFSPNKDKVDYPHNPVISAFLYSGIIGGLVYIWFLILTLVYYYKYREKLGILFILFLVTSFFVFFSGNSHFSVPAYSMLSVVPFIYRYYKQKILTHATVTQNSDIRRK